MRCTRCNRPAVPQAIGKTREGLVVFGWCVPCLETTGCREVRVAHTPRRQSTRLVLREHDPRDALAQWVHRNRRERPRPTPLDTRRGLVTLVASLLGAWGLLLIVTGLALRQYRAPAGGVSPLGNGTPALLVGGGTATALIALVLRVSIRAPRRARRLRPRNLIQTLSFLVALGILTVAIILHDAHRTPYLIVTAAAILAISWMTRRLENRRTIREDSVL